MFHNHHILLVEDDEVDFLQFRRMMQLCGFNYVLTRAYDGLQAIELLKGNGKEIPLKKPQIILLDLNMPKMNGLEFLSEIRKDKDLKNIMVIVFSSSSEKSDMELAMQHQVAGYIIKPSSTESFSDTVDKLGHFLKICEFPSA